MSTPHNKDTSPIQGAEEGISKKKSFVYAASYHVHHEIIQMSTLGHPHLGTSHILQKVVEELKCRVSTNNFHSDVYKMASHISGVGRRGAKGQCI